MGAVNNVKGQKEVRWGGHDRQARVRNPMDVYAEPRVQCQVPGEMAVGSTVSANTRGVPTWNSQLKPAPAVCTQVVLRGGAQKARQRVSPEERRNKGKERKSNMKIPVDTKG